MQRTRAAKLERSCQGPRWAHWTPPNGKEKSKCKMMRIGDERRCNLSRMVKQAKLARASHLRQAESPTPALAMIRTPSACRTNVNLSKKSRLHIPPSMRWTGLHLASCSPGPPPLLRAAKCSKRRLRAHLPLMASAPCCRSCLERAMPTTDPRGLESCIQ